VLSIGVITLGGLGITRGIITPSDIDWGNNPRWLRELQDVSCCLGEWGSDVRDYP
jgi:hypothetical protein